MAITKVYIMLSADFHLDIRIKVSNPTAFFKKLAKEKREQNSILHHKKVAEEKREENIQKVHFPVIDSETNHYLKFYI